MATETVPPPVPDRMILEFERPIIDLERKISELRGLSTESVDFSAEIRRLVVQPDDYEAALALLAVAAPRAATRLLVAYVAEAGPLAALLPALGFRELDPDLEMICPL